MSISIAIAPSNMPTDQGAPPPPAPLPHRRPRVREVSSRFMSPSPSPSSGDLHSLSVKSPVSKPKQSAATPGPPRRRQEHEPLSCCGHENIPETLRSLDTPFHHRNNTKPNVPLSTTQRKQRAAKLFKENGNGEASRTGKYARPDTPTVDRIVPSRFKLPQRPTSSDATKLLHSTGLSFSSVQPCSDSNSDTNESDSIQGSSSCPNSPMASQHTRTCPLPDARSSMPDGDMLPTRFLGQTASKLSTPAFCSRSLNLPLSACQQSFRSSGKPPAANSQSAEIRSLPPQPTGMRPGVGVDSRKGRKPHTSQEEMHSFKLLHNHYLLWRFANAKAEASIHAQTTGVQNQFFSLGADISRLRDTVKRKRVELAVLRQTKALSTILEAHMPYIDEWSALEEDCTDSLSGVTNALMNSLLRLPVSGNVQVNIKEASEALESALKTMEMIAGNVQSFLPKAEDMDNLMSELASVIDVERALIQECGNLLAKTQTSQVEDCSLRGHLMQLHCKNLF